MIKKRDEAEKLKVENVAKIRTMAIGYNKDSFAIAINEKGEGEFEAVYTVSADKLQEIVSILFQAGVEYQQETKVDIGFGIGDSYEE